MTKAIGIDELAPLLAGHMAAVMHRAGMEFLSGLTVKGMSGNPHTTREFSGYLCSSVASDLSVGVIVNGVGLECLPGLIEQLEAHRIRFGPEGDPHTITVEFKS